MKVVKVTLLFIVFICLSSVMGQVTVLFDKTFDGEATGADPADFELIEDGTANVSIAEFPSFLDKSLLTQGHDDGNVRATLPLNIDHGILVIEWDWYFTRHNIQFQIEGDLIDQGGNDDVCHIYSFRTDLVDADSNMACVGSDAAQTRVPLGYFGGIETWVKMKVVFSLDDPWVHIFVNDTLRYADLPKSGRILANTTAILWKHGDKESYINNLKLTHFQQGGGTAVEDIALRIPDSYQLQQNFPNPFNPSTTISYQLKQTADVRLEIYDLLGHKVRTLVKGSKTAGVYSVTWDATNDAGQKVVNGVYIYRLGISGKGEDFTESRKMVLLK